MSVQDLLSKLEKVKQTNKGGWIARCPSHKDKNPSMTIAEVDDGRVLVHCFAGCGIDDIMGAVGLELDVLFPPKPLTHHNPRIRKPFNAHAVLEAISTETLIVQLAAGDIAAGRPLDDTARERLKQAAARIHAARGLCE